jgi:Rrf2 family protein
VQLELGSEERYALRALIYLALVGEQTTADRVSAEAHIPRRLLARIPAKLSHAGLVQSEQGRGGGSRLARPAGKITLREVVEAIEGPFGVIRCIMEDPARGEGAPCARTCRQPSGPPRPTSRSSMCPRRIGPPPIRFVAATGRARRRDPEAGVRSARECSARD